MSAPPPSESPARPFALLVLFVLMLTAGIGLAATTAGRVDLALQLCSLGGAIVIVILVAGAAIVGRLRQ